MVTDGIRALILEYFGYKTKVFEFTNKRVVEHFEDIKGFLAHKKVENMREFEK